LRHLSVLLLALAASAAKAAETATNWKATASTDQWLQLDFGKPTTIDEFRIREDASSSVARYSIEPWSDKASRWMGCFNGRSSAGPRGKCGC
jgi:hypothetical protein